MKSDIIIVTNTGKGMTAALEQAAASASYRGLSGKEALHLRLLAEEMLGMVRQITGETEAVFWVESEGTGFELHLAAQPIVTSEMRKELLSVSTSGKNAAAVGVMGKLRDIFERAFDAEAVGKPSAYAKYYMRGLLVSADPDAMDPMTFALNASLDADMVQWSMRKYKDSVEQERTEDEEAQEEWDELEQRINPVYPGFTNKLFNLCPLSVLEYHVCLLIKLHVPPTEMASILCKDRSSISAIRSRLYKKVFQQKGSSKLWDEFVLSL